VSADDAPNKQWALLLVYIYLSVLQV